MNDCGFVRSAPLGLRVSQAKTLDSREAKDFDEEAQPLARERAAEAASVVSF